MNKTTNYKLQTTNYQPVIGLEVHVELNTRTKMFCYCSADYFGKEPNTHTCPVCLGLPGALPYTNEKALEGCMKIGLALNCTVSEKSIFERKNYFYPDLPKGYQISQYRWPLCVGGFLLVVDSSGREIKIRINRVHQEEDTGKLAHQDGETLIDFNRSGVPLVEIVTEPDFHDSSEVRDYAKKLQQLFRYLGVSNADMERGDMRLEANVSVRKLKDQELPSYRVELKNINSFRFMVAAIEYEIKRQIEALEKGEKLTQETRGWNEDKKETYLQRSKEEANDYRYFPEPDIPELRIKNQELSLIKELPELPWVKVKRFMEEYGLNKNSAEILTENRALAEYFEEAVKVAGVKGIEAKQMANYMVNQKLDIRAVTPQELIGQMVEKNSGILEDDSELEKIIERVIKENPCFVDDYKNGKLSILNALIGSVIKKAGGKVNIGKVRSLLEEKLK